MTIDDKTESISIQNKATSVLIQFPSRQDFQRVTDYLQEKGINFYPMGFCVINIKEEYLPELDISQIKYERISSLEEVYSNKEMMQKYQREVEEFYKQEIK